MLIHIVYKFLALLIVLSIIWNVIYFYFIIYIYIYLIFELIIIICENDLH